jgi:hypothetical protein
MDSFIYIVISLLKNLRFHELYLLYDQINKMYYLFDFFFSTSFEERKEEVVAQRNGKRNGYSQLIIITFKEKKKWKELLLRWNLNLILILYYLLK